MLDGHLSSFWFVFSSLYILKVILFRENFLKCFNSFSRVFLTTCPVTLCWHFVEKLYADYWNSYLTNSHVHALTVPKGTYLLTLASLHYVAHKVPRRSLQPHPRWGSVFLSVLFRLTVAMTAWAAHSCVFLLVSSARLLWWCWLQALSRGMVYPVPPS